MELKKTYEMDMCTGPVLKKIIVFAIPLMLSGMLQLLFNAVDIIVVGQFSGNQDLAAVGSTGSIIGMNIRVFMGLSIGTNVIAARYYGGKDDTNLHEAVHTAILTAFVVGVLLIAVGILAAEPMLKWMGTPEDVLYKAKLYIQIYFIGMPFFMVYNFGAAVLKAIGDTKRPLYFLLISGVVNMVLNLIFVICFQLGVAGVATATVVSQGISAVCVMLCLCKDEGAYRVKIKELKIYKQQLLEMLRIGLPAGIQGLLITFSNVMIQSSINSFGSIAMAGCTAASNIESFLHAAEDAIAQTALSFVSQNIGAKDYKRVKNIIMDCVMLVIILGCGMGAAVYMLQVPLLHIYSPDPTVVARGMEKLSVISIPYAIYGLMNLFPSILRGMGYSLQPALITLLGTCLFRIVWIYTVFQVSRSLFVLYLSYPVSWAATSVILILFFMAKKKKMKL